MIRDDSEVTKELEQTSGFANFVGAFKATLDSKLFSDQVTQCIDVCARGWEPYIAPAYKIRFYFNVFIELNLYQNILSSEPSPLQLQYKSKIDQVIDAFDVSKYDPREGLRDYREIPDFKSKVDEKVKAWFTIKCVRAV